MPILVACPEHARGIQINANAPLVSRVYHVVNSVYVRKALAAPSRHLSGYLSHTILYPSVRFGRSLKLESRNLEYPYCMTMAYRADVLCVLEQPPLIQIVIPGHKGWLEYVPDLLVITATGIEIWETKHKAELAEKCIKHPNRYQEQKGVYRSSPVEAYFAKWGFKYAIVTEEGLHPAFCQATNFLHGYVQGYPNKPITEQERADFVGYVRSHSGVRLGDIPATDTTRRNELALYFLAQAVVFTSFSEADFKQPTALRLYDTAQDEQAFHQYLNHARPRPANIEELGYRLKQGVLIEIGKTDYIHQAQRQVCDQAARRRKRPRAAIRRLKRTWDRFSGARWLTPAAHVCTSIQTLSQTAEQTIRDRSGFASYYRSRITTSRSQRPISSTNSI